METGVSAYENSVRFYFSEDATTEAVDLAFWNEVDARIKHLCSDLAKELSTKYSVMITASVGGVAEEIRE
jgi:hypothetical protein